MRRRPLGARGRHVAVWLALLCLPSVANGQDDQQVPSLHAGAVIENIRLDGIVDEAAWSAAETIDNLTMIVIYDHNVLSIEERWRLDSHQLLVKLQYAFRY